MKRRTAPFTNIRRERVSADYGDKLSWNMPSPVWVELLLNLLGNGRPADMRLFVETTG